MQKALKIAGNLLSAAMLLMVAASPILAIVQQWPFVQPQL